MLATLRFPFGSTAVLPSIRKKGAGMRTRENPPRYSVDGALLPDNRGREATPGFKNVR
jgi:hypothetical protein